jgi:vacuolar-type H+-ATPase subunit H
MTEMDSIKRVQAAESKAKETIAKAHAAAQAKIEAANAHAQNVIASSETDALELRAKAEKERSLKIDAYKTAEAKRIDALSGRISKIKISAAEMGRIAEEVAKEAVA